MKRFSSVQIKEDERSALRDHPSRISARPALREVQNEPKQVTRGFKSLKSESKKTISSNVETRATFIDSPRTAKGNEFKNNKQTNNEKSLEEFTNKMLGKVEMSVGSCTAPKSRTPLSDIENFVKGSVMHMHVHCGEECCKSRAGGCSPINSNAGIANNVLLTEFIMPARKTTLLKARRLRMDIKDETSPYTGDIFNKPYLSENLEESLRIDGNYLKRRYPSKQNPYIQSPDRIEILHWILRISDDIRLSRHVYFKFVRLFDNILENLSIPKNMLQLVAIVTCWILMKSYEIRIPSSTKLSTLCAKVYSIRQIIQMEMKLLKYTQFTLNINSPRDFFYFQLQLKDEELLHCINYILELFTFNQKFSMYTSCELASAAIYLATDYLGVDREDLCVLNKLDDVREIVFLMDAQMMKLYSGRPLKEHEILIYKNYSLLEYSQISTKLQEFVAIPEQRAKKFYYY